MGFLTIDIVLLAIFIIFISIFLYTRKHNLKREGLLYLYRTKLGMKFIDYVGGKYKKSLNFLSYISVTLGYLLMAGVFYMFGRILWIYVLHPSVVRAIKIPPITPLIPYLPQIFKIDFLPPFFFTYWIIILAIIAITHEFAHGIFMKRYNIKIKSTGFGFFPYFLPIFLAAFVEQDEKSMVKASKFKQMAVLSAGTFANTLTAIFFFGVMFIFFSLAFSPAGVIFNDYSYSVVELASITMINGVSLDNPTLEKIKELSKENSLNNIEANGKTYKGFKEFSSDGVKVALYDNAPAINSKLTGAISEINGVRVNSVDALGKELAKYPPGEKITIKTVIDEETSEQEIVLGENPYKPGKSWLGIGFNVREGGLITKIISGMSSFKNPNVYYGSQIYGGLFIYNLLWWLILISISVALVNMLPVGIFDGGRFFYLTIWGITKSEPKARKAFKFMTYLFLALVVVLMLLWGWSFIK